MWIALILVACSGDDNKAPTDGLPSSTETADTGSGTTETGMTVTIVASTISPTVVEVSWTPPETGAHYVTAQAAGEPEVRLDPQETTTRFVGLVAGLEYTIEAHTVGVESHVGTAFYRVPGAPTNLPELSVTSASDHSLEGGVLVTTVLQADGGWLVAYDAQGRLVWWWDVGHRIGADVPGYPGWNGAALPVTSRLDGGDLLVAAYDTEQSIDVGRMWRIPVDAMSAGDLVITRTPFAHHDFVYHRDEQVVAWLGYQFETIDKVDWASDQILENPEEAEGVALPQWSWLDNYGQTVGPISPRTDEFVQQTLAQSEWTHSNSLMYDAPSRSYFVMSKFHDSLVRVDRDTDETVWTLGGPYSDFTLANGDPVWSDSFNIALWSHAHMSHLWVNEDGVSGGFVVFDNGYNYPAMIGSGFGWSRVSEYRYDESTMTVEKVWETLHPEGRFTQLMGDIRKLDTVSPRYLVAWSTLGCIEELREDGSSAWEGCVPLGQIFGRTTWYEGLMPTGD